MDTPLVREERSGDADAVRHVLKLAFHGHPHSNGREFALVDALRGAEALDVSLVAEMDGLIVGYTTFSKVTVSGIFCDWYGLGPVAVLPNYQDRGVGSLLIREGLERLRAHDAAGCVVLGEPAYYSRFGFGARPELRLDGVPAEYFMALSFDGSLRRGTVEYRPEFEEVS